MITLIAAADQHDVIGVNGSLPWHSPLDLARFKRLTQGHTVLMGRKTFDSLGRIPLPGRENLVLTRYGIDMPRTPGVDYVHDLAQVVYDDRFDSGEQLFVIGGGVVYESAIHDADVIELTRMHYAVDIRSDDDVTYFPRLDPATWRLVSEEKVGSIMSFLRYESLH